MANQYNSNQQAFYLSLPWRVRATLKLSRNSEYAEKLTAKGANAASVLSASTTKAYLDYRRSQAKAQPATVVECKSTAEFSKEIIKVLMDPSAAERFRPDSGDLWQMVVEVAGSDSSRSTGPVTIFIVLDMRMSLSRVDVVTRSSGQGNFHESDKGTWLTIVHATGDVDGVTQQRARSASVFDEIPMTRERR